jgi:voltage-gated potassium channel
VKQNSAIQTLGRLRNGFLLLAAILAIGTIGYTWLEGVTPLEAFYDTVLVVSTLGFGRYVPSTTSSIVLTIILIFSGVGTVYYLLVTFAEAVIETSLGTQQERRMERRIAKMRGHHIICGYGRVGHHAARELNGEDVPFVIIDNDPEAVEFARSNGYAALLGDATQDQVLRQAGIDRASSLLITTASDAANVFIALTARSFNQTLQIVARASSESSESKLIAAGADKVVAPEIIGGQHMALLALRPETIHVVNTLTHVEDTQSWIDEATLDELSSLCGGTLDAACIHDKTGATVIAIRHADGRLITNPSGDEALQPGDILISVGNREQLLQLEALARPAEEHLVRERGGNA